MSFAYDPGGPSRGLPPRDIPAAGVTPAAAGGSEPVPAGAEPPVYQPWVLVLQNAQSRLKTDVQAALRTYNRQTADAGRLLDTARAIASVQSKQLETAAWEAWHRMMAEAAAVTEAIMTPALTAYKNAMDGAHDQLRKDLTPVEERYKQVAADAQWTQGITKTGSATV